MARHPFPWDRFLALAADLPSGRHSLAGDAYAMVERIEPAPVVMGAERIPAVGGCVVAANHYQRRGLWIAWPGAVITASVGARRGQDPPVHWLVTGGLRLAQWKNAGPEVPLSGALMQRVALTYGMVALPLSKTRRRAAALRRWLGLARSGKVLGIFPEGLGGRSDGLRPPTAGFDALCRLLADVPWVPAGIYEVDDQLCVQFGPPLRLTGEDGQGERVMAAIAALLPAERRGVYAASRQH